MRYQLVALFDKNSYSYIEEIQKNICKKHKIYRNMPMLHIDLEIVGDPDIEKLNKILSDMLRPYKKFKVEINGAICFDPSYKSVNLKVENKGYIIRLARKINETLKLHGFDVRDNVGDWDLHVTLGNTNYPVKEWSSKEYVAACQSDKKENIHRMAKVDRIELWKPINNKKETVIKSFSLKDF